MQNANVVALKDQKHHKKECAQLSKENTSFRDVSASDLASSTSPSMIFYPEKVVTVDNITDHDGTGTVGHNATFVVVASIIANRIRDTLLHSSENDSIMKRLLTILYAEPQHEEEPRLVSERQAAIAANLASLHLHVAKSTSFFLIIPLKQYYLSVHHELLLNILDQYGMPPGLVAQVEKAYNKNVKIHIHSKGPCVDKSSPPPKKDLIGPITFGNRLRQQCPITPILAIIQIHALLQVSKLLEKDEQIYLFPHALVIESETQEEMKSIVGHFSTAIRIFGNSILDFQVACCTVGSCELQYRTSRLDDVFPGFLC